MDGYGSYLTRQFIEYTASHKIQLFALPPHTTHFLQPLDVGCFQPLKWYYGKCLDFASRTGAKDITKTDFFVTIAWVRQETFRLGIIRSGWRRSGIYPFNPQLMLDELERQEAEENAAVASYKPLPVQAPPTPTFVSSDFEEYSDEEYARASSAYNQARQRLLEVYHKSKRPKTPPLIMLAPGEPGWQTPLTIRTLKRQHTAIKDA
ncbi:DDE-domain-containing protein, partial [Zopfia rhizophila CBS 207.26]